MSPSVKYCVVPLCKNSETKTPEKLFFNVPKDPNIRPKWINAIRRAHPLGPKTTAYCCEDHFDKETDMENYLRYRLMGGILKLKKDVLPHKFACQNKENLLAQRSTYRKKLQTAPKQQQRTPAGLFSCNNETDSGDDRENDTKYERDSSIKTGDDETQSEIDRTHNETDSGDDRVDEDDSIYYELPLSPIKTEDDDGEATVPEGSRRQEGCRCDVCRGDIVGFRYACVQCDNFDLCGACEARGEHATHYVLRVPPNKLHSDVQAVIERIRDQLLEEYTIKLEVKEEVLEPDPLEETTSAEAEDVLETSCQDTKREESEDTLDVNLLDRSERDFKVSPPYPPSVPQDQPRQPQQNLQIISHQPQVLTRQPTVPKVLFHHPNILIRQPRILIQRLKVTSKTPEVQSKVPQVLSHQPQVAPSATSKEKRLLMLEEQTSTSEELNPARKKRKELNPARKKRKELIV